MFNPLIKGYSFDSLREVFLSVFPGFKYHIAAALVTLNVSVGALALLLGMESITLWAWIITAALELATGIYASWWIKGEPFESGKLGRWGFKIAIMIGGLFALHTFAQHWSSDSVMNDAFGWAYNFLFAQGASEYVISILENYATITGRPKDFYIAGFKDKLANAFQNFLK